MGDPNGLTNGIGPVELWRHPDPESTRMAEFRHRINKKYKLKLSTYEDLHQWSIDNIPEFWEETWHFVGITASRSFDLVRVGFSVYPRDLDEPRRLQLLLCFSNPV